MSSVQESTIVASGSTEPVAEDSVADALLENSSSKESSRPKHRSSKRSSKDAKDRSSADEASASASPSKSSSSSSKPHKSRSSSSRQTTESRTSVPDETDETELPEKSTTSQSTVSSRGTSHRYDGGASSIVSLYDTDTKSDRDGDREPSRNQTSTKGKQSCEQEPLKLWYTYNFNHDTIAPHGHVGFVVASDESEAIETLDQCLSSHRLLPSKLKPYTLIPCTPFGPRCFSIDDTARTTVAAKLDCELASEEYKHKAKSGKDLKFFYASNCRSYCPPFLSVMVAVHKSLEEAKKLIRKNATELGMSHSDRVKVNEINIFTTHAFLTSGVADVPAVELGKKRKHESVVNNADDFVNQSGRNRTPNIKCGGDIQWGLF
jgi:hypothetical protein